MPIFNENYNSLGRNLGSGLSDSLSRLAEGKFKQINERNQAKKFTDTGFFSPQDAQFIQAFPEKDRWKIAQALAQDQRGQQQQQQMTPEQQNLQKYQMMLQDPHQQQMQPQQQQQQYQQPQMGQQGFIQQPQGQRDFGERIRGVTGPANTAQQRAIDATNSSFNKVFDKARDNAESIYEVAQAMKELRATGKVASGAGGAVRGLSKQFQNQETQLFDKYSKQLAQMLSSQVGLPTKFKIQYAEEQKPSIDQLPGVQDALIEEILKNSGKILQKGNIRDQLIAGNNYNQPSNIEQRIEQYYKQLQGQGQGQYAPFGQQQPQQEQGQQPQAAQSSQEESLLGQGARGAVRTAARIGESVLGSVGDLASAGLGLTSWATGGKTPTYEDIQNYLPISAPTSDQIKHTLSGITHGYTDPQGGYEDILDNVISTAASLFGPGKAKALAGRFAAGQAPKVANAITKAAKIAFPLSGTDSWQRALKTAAAGEIGAQAAGLLGGGPIAQSIGKFGMMTAYGIAGTRKALNDTMHASYSAAGKELGTLVREGENTVKATPINDAVKSMKEGLNRTTGPDKDIIKSIIDDVEGAIKESAYGTESNILGAEEFVRKKDALPIKNIWDMKKKLNDWIGLGYTQKVQGEKYLPASARPEVEKLNRILTKELADYGLKNPKFGKPFADAEELWKGLNVKNSMFNFINKKYENASTAEKVAAGSFGGVGIFHGFTWLIGHPMLGVGIGGSLAAAIEGEKLGRLIYRSPEARRAYLNAIKNAAQENQNGFERDLAALGREMSHHEKHQRR